MSEKDKKVVYPDAIHKVIKECNEYNEYKISIDMIHLPVRLKDKSKNQQ